jgi:hypothetical protein
VGAEGELDEGGGDDVGFFGRADEEGFAHDASALGDGERAQAREFVVQGWKGSGRDARHSLPNGLLCELPSRGQCVSHPVKHTKVSEASDEAHKR